MITITQEFETEREARGALSASSYWCSLFDLDEWLRQQIKHNVDLTDDQEIAYNRVRVELREIMDNNGVNLLDYE